VEGRSKKRNGLAEESHRGRNSNRLKIRKEEKNREDEGSLEGKASYDLSFALGKEKASSRRLKKKRARCDLREKIKGGKRKRDYWVRKGEIQRTPLSLMRERRLRPAAA